MDNINKLPIPDDIERVETSQHVTKSAEQVEYELNHPEEYEKQLKEKMLEDARKRAARVDQDKAMLHSIETNGWDGLDGGQRYTALAPDSMGRKLTAKEILFCRYYVCTNNIKQSLVLAGMPATNAQMRLIHRPDIRGFISELTDLRLKQLGYDRHTVIKNLAIIANQDVSDYIDIVKTQRKTKDGQDYTRTDVAIKDFDDINREYVRDEYGELLLDQNGQPIAISSEKTKAIKSVRLGDNGQLQVEFHDKMTALKQLANMLDMESPQKITLNDETKRAETEKSILKKLQALTADKEAVNNVEESSSEVKEKPSNDNNSEALDK